MPKVSYSEEEREKIRDALVDAGLDLMTKQGIQHTTVEQIYKKVGISRTFFYTFFPTKEDLIVEARYLQQPEIIEYAQKLMDDPSRSWREGVKQFLHSCCYGEKYGIAVLSIEEQQLIFKRLSERAYHTFRQRQFLLFNGVLNTFGICVNAAQTQLMVNLFLSVVVICKALPGTLPLLVPEAADETVDFQIESIVDYLEKQKK